MHARPFLNVTKNLLPGNLGLKLEISYFTYPKVIRDLTSFDMALFDRLKLGIFDGHNDTTTNFHQRQT